MTGIKIYTVNYCPYSMKAKLLLNKLGIEYEEIDITVDEPEMRIKLGEMTGGSQSTPQVFVGEKFFGGYDRLYEAYISGELGRLCDS